MPHLDLLPYSTSYGGQRSDTDDICIQYNLISLLGVDISFYSGEITIINIQYDIDLRRGVTMPKILFAAKYDNPNHYSTKNDNPKHYMQLHHSLSIAQGYLLDWFNWHLRLHFIDMNKIHKISDYAFYNQGYCVSTFTRSMYLLACAHTHVRHIHHTFVCTIIFQTINQTSSRSMKMENFRIYYL